MAQGSMLKIVNTGWGKRLRKCFGGLLYRVKYNTYTSIIPRQKSHWTMNRHLNKGGQKWKTSHNSGRVLRGEGG
jgi:hypothetical protein